jgi:hypothetical protein
VLSSATVAQNAHWTQVPTNIPLNARAAISPYFLNQNLGFIFSPAVIHPGASMVQENGSTYFSRTTDGGQSWTSLPFFDSIGCLITQLCFVSIGRGYAATIGATAQNIDSCGIFETLDTGSHWRRISPRGQAFVSVYSANDFVAAVQFFGNQIGYNNLCFTSDAGKNWNRLKTVPAPPSGQQTFQYVTGNRDSLIALLSVNQVRTTYLTFSTDLGQSWNFRFLDSNSGAFHTLPSSLYVFPHERDVLAGYLSAFDISGDTYSFEHSSLDFQNWNDILQRVETGAFFAGNSCALYLSSANYPRPGQGLLRSTDHGANWALVAGPNFTEIDDGDFQNLAVVGYGAVVYAGNPPFFVGGRRSLWKTTDGGDGTLSAGQLSPRVGIQVLSQNLTGDTLTIAPCDTSIAMLCYRNLSCGYSGLRLSRISITGLDSSEYRILASRSGVANNAPDTIGIQMWPSLPGTYLVTADASFLTDEYELIDTIIKLTIAVPRLVSHPFLTSDTLKAVSSLCTEVHRGLKLWNNGCQGSFTVYSIALIDSTSDVIVGGAFSFDSLPLLPKTFGPGARDSIGYVWNPSKVLKSDSSVIVRVIVRYTRDSTGVTFDTVLTFLLSTNPGSIGHILSTNSLSFDTLNVCSVRDTFLTLENIGCYPLKIDSATLVGPEYSSSIMPQSIASGATLSFPLTYAPLQKGASSGSLKLYINENGHHSVETIILSATAVGERATFVCSSTTNLLDFGAVSTCSPSDSLQLSLRNFGCDTLTITKMNLVGGSGILDSKLSDQLPKKLIGFDSCLLTVSRSVGSAGTYLGTLTFEYVLPDGTIHDTSYHVTATIFSGTRALSIDSSLRAFGTGNLCQVADTLIIFQNTGCDTLTVGSVSIAGQYFSLLKGSASILLPLAKDTLDIGFFPTTDGVSTGILTIKSNADDDSIVNIPLTAQTVAPQTLTLKTSLSRTNIPTGDTTTLFVSPTSNVTVPGLSTLSYTISYDGDLLTYVPATATASSGFAFSNPVETHTGKTSTLKMTLTSTGNPTTFTQGKPLASVRFHTRLTDSLSTPITLSNLVLNSGDSVFNKCTLSLSDTGTSFTIALNCVDSTINAALRGNLAFVVQSIVPNPTDGKLSVSLSGNRPIWVLYDLYDLVGHSVMHGTFAGSTNALDVSALSSGSYYLRMSAAGEVVSRKVVVRR